MIYNVADGINLQATGTQAIVATKITFHTHDFDFRGVQDFYNEASQVSATIDVGVGHLYCVVYFVSVVAPN